MMISSHASRLQDFLDVSSSSMPSNILSMGEDLVDERRPYGVQGS
jgi:hypothetical protein